MSLLKMDPYSDLETFSSKGEQLRLLAQSLRKQSRELREESQHLREMSRLVREYTQQHRAERAREREALLPPSQTSNPTQETPPDSPTG